MLKSKTKDKKVLKNTLEGLYRKYNHKKFIPPDPLQFVYHYKKKADSEIAGFLAALFAYGAVEQIEKFLTILLGKMGNSPAEFIKNFSAKDRGKFKSLKYRFNNSGDIISLLEILKKVLIRYGSIENLFLKGYSEADENILPAAEKFNRVLLKIHNGKVSGGLKFLLSDPAKGGTCKRLFLFLRWMVRKDEVDIGLWKKIDKSKLIVPVDVHIGRLSKIIGLHNRETVNLKIAVEITEGFKKICSADPVKYDFSLCRIGILENCTGRLRQALRKESQVLWTPYGGQSRQKNDYCPNCELAEFCRRK